MEGRITTDDKVVLVEDLISTGGSSLKAAEVLRSAGTNVLGVIAIFDYGFPDAVRNFEDAGLPFYTLSNYESLLPEALRQGIITESELETLATWRNDPANWGVPA